MACLYPNNNYLVIPPREWSRVQNPCSLINEDIPNYVISPINGQLIPSYQYEYELKLLYKGNILQYKANSSNLTKKQIYSKMAKNLWTSRNKTYATQSSNGYTNPNTQSLKRVDDSLLCNIQENILTGETKTTLANQNCFLTTDSDVPGTIQPLCWKSNLPTYYPRQRYIMTNSGNKFPTNAILNSVTFITPPVPPIPPTPPTPIIFKIINNLIDFIIVTTTPYYVSDNTNSNLIVEAPNATIYLPSNSTEGTNINIINKTDTNITINTLNGELMYNSFFIEKEGSTQFIVPKNKYATFNYAFDYNKNEYYWNVSMNNNIFNVNNIINENIDATNNGEQNIINNVNNNTNNTNNTKNIKKYRNKNKKIYKNNNINTSENISDYNNTNTSIFLNLISSSEEIINNNIQQINKFTKENNITTNNNNLNNIFLSFIRINESNVNNNSYYIDKNANYIVEFPNCNIYLPYSDNLTSLNINKGILINIINKSNSTIKIHSQNGEKIYGSFHINKDGDETLILSKNMFGTFIYLKRENFSNVWAVSTS